MGLIQSSLNNLVLSSIGAVGALGYGLKGAFKTKKPQASQPQGENPKVETTSGMGNIVKIGRDYSRKGSRSYMAAVKAVYSGNDMIAQKARATFTPAADLKDARMRAALSLSVANSLKKEKKGDKE